MYYMEKRIGMRFGFLIVFIFNDIQKNIPPCVCLYTLIGLYHFCMEYYKNKMVYLNIILIIKHRFYEKTRKQLRQKMRRTIQ